MRKADLTGDPSDWYIHAVGLVEGGGGPGTTVTISRFRMRTEWDHEGKETIRVRGRDYMEVIGTTLDAAALHDAFMGGLAVDPKTVTDESGLRTELWLDAVRLL